jgi:hypothetical protein
VRVFWGDNMSSTEAMSMNQVYIRIFGLQTTLETCPFIHSRIFHDPTPSGDFAQVVTRPYTFCEYAGKYNHRICDESIINM